MCVTNLLDFVADSLRTTDRGVKRLGKNLVAFSSGGSDELVRFADWLKRYGYVQEAFSAKDIDFSVWAMLLSHPLGMPNIETVEFGLWDSAEAAGHVDRPHVTSSPFGCHAGADIEPALCP